MLKTIVIASFFVTSAVNAQNWYPVELPRTAYRAETQLPLSQQRSQPISMQQPQPSRSGGLLGAMFGTEKPHYVQPQYAAVAPQPIRPQTAMPQEPAQSFDERFTPQQVRFETNHAPGTVIIDTQSKFLHLVMDNGQAMRYGVGVGRPGFTWKGVKTISRKAEWPDWRPPAQMLLRRPDLPKYMAGGETNPLGARAMYLGSTLYRIHGTNEPHTIGHSVSSGCFRMRNEDVTDLYSRVRVGTKVVVL